MHTDTSTHAEIVLKDRALFRQACYIDGAWVTAGSGATITVDDPATGQAVGVVPSLGRRDASGH